MSNDHDKIFTQIGHADRQSHIRQLMPWLLQAEIAVRTQLNQLGAWLNVRGWNWNPGSNVQIFADGVPRRAEQFSLGQANPSDDGSFDVWFDIRCTVTDPADPEYGKRR